MSRAQRDLNDLFDQIDAIHSDAALIWYHRLKKAIQSLHKQPNRRPVTRRPDGLRQLLYGNKPHIYRVIFRVFEKQKIVEVLHIRHGARRQYKKSDLK